MTHSLLFGSGSPYKVELLERLNIEFDAESSSVEESKYWGERPVETARLRSKAKMRNLKQRYSDRFILTSDQVVGLDGEVFEKPGNRENAIRHLQQLEGSTHRLITVIDVTNPSGEEISSEVVFEMKMRSLSSREIETYIDEDEPFDCAGAYKIEDGGIRLFEQCSGPDYTAIIGLPLTRVWRSLMDAGFL